MTPGTRVRLLHDWHDDRGGVIVKTRGDEITVQFDDDPQPLSLADRWIEVMSDKMTPVEIAAERISYHDRLLTTLSRDDLLEALVTANRRIDQLTAERNELDRKLLRVTAERNDIRRYHAGE